MGPQQPEADVAVDLGASPTPALLGRQLTYTATVTNHDPSAAGRVRLTQALPATARFVAVATSRGTCAETDGTLRCELGVLVAGSAATVTVTVRPLRLDPLTSTATVAARQPDPNPANNTYAEVTPVATH